jgi:hypothetical protein
VVVRWVGREVVDFERLGSDGLETDFNYTDFYRMLDVECCLKFAIMM